jgi:tetratricopeptide (TPR) repeat protein
LSLTVLSCVGCGPSESDWLQAGDKALAANDWDTAYDAFSHAIKVAPRSAEPFARRAEVSLEQWRYHEAVADLTQAIVRSPKTASYYALRAQAYLRQENYSAARADVDQALSIDPENAEYLVLRASTLIASNDAEQALRDLDQALAKYRNHAHAYWLRASVHEQLGHTDEAERDRKKAVNLDPSFALAKTREGKRVLVEVEPGYGRTIEQDPLQIQTPLR